MEDFKKYCCNNNVFKFKVEEFDFVCEEMTTGEEALFYNYYIEPSGIENVAKLGLVRLTKLKETPFTKEWITHLIQIEKEWEDLSLFNRLKFLENLKPSFSSKLLSEINIKYNELNKETKN